MPLNECVVINLPNQLQFQFLIEFEQVNGLNDCAFMIFQKNEPMKKLILYSHLSRRNNNWWQTQLQWVFIVNNKYGMTKNEQCFFVWKKRIGTTSENM